MITPPPAAAPAALVGLSEEQAAMAAEEYFAAFSWVPLVLDPETISAEEFLAAL